MRPRAASIWFTILAAVLIGLNGLTLFSAIPSTSGTQSFCDTRVGCITVARDFSAYYEAGYRFIFNPSSVYQEGNVSGDYQILPNAQNFRYAPFFLLFMVPFVVLFSYQNAIRAFDILQFALLPIIAYLLFEIMKLTSGGRESLPRRTIACYTVTFVLALLQPFVPSASDLSSGIWSWTYWRLWVEGEARVLQAALLVLTVFLVLRNSRLSGLAFVLGSFDPRISLLALPVVLYLCIRVKNLRMFALSFSVSFLLICVPTLLYANLGGQFLATVLIKPTAIYSYEWVPVLTVVSLSATIFLLEFTRRREVVHSGTNPSR